MPIRYLLVILLLSGCATLSKLKSPFKIKAVLEGEIKGHQVRCEKNIDLSQGQWGVLCEIGGGIFVHYQPNQINSQQMGINFLVTKEKAGLSKVIAAPMLIMQAGHSVSNQTLSKSAKFAITAEQIP